MEIARKAWLAGALVAGIAAPVAADTRIDYTVEGSDGVVETVLIGHGKMRMNQHGIGYWNLYDPASDIFYQVNDARKEYWQIDHAQMRRLEQQTVEAVRYVEKMWPVVIGQMRILDRGYPELMEQARNMSGDLRGAAAKLRKAGVRDIPSEQQMDEVSKSYQEWSKYKTWEEAVLAESRKQYQWSLQNTTRFSVKKTGRRTVAGYPCNTTEITLSTAALPKPVKLMEYCGVMPAALKLPVAERGVIEDLRRATEMLAARTNEAVLVPPAVAKQLGIKSKVTLGIDQITLDALPVETRYYTGNKVTSTSTLSRISTNETLAPEQFRVPKGYRRYDPAAALQPVLDSVAEIDAANRRLQSSGLPQAQD